MERWHQFTAYNAQSCHGYGTIEEAEQYCAYLNRNREINVYSVRAMSGAETIALDSGADSFRLDVELDAIAEADEGNSDALADAEAAYDKAREHYEYWLKTKFGSDWEAHYGDYTHDMNACIGRTMYRGLHEAKLALESAKSADHE